MQTIQVSAVPLEVKFQLDDSELSDLCVRHRHVSFLHTATMLPFYTILFFMLLWSTLKTHKDNWGNEMLLLELFWQVFFPIPKVITAESEHSSIKINHKILMSFFYSETDWNKNSLSHTHLMCYSHFGILWPQQILFILRRQIESRPTWWCSG